MTPALNGFPKLAASLAAVAGLAGANSAFAQTRSQMPDQMEIPAKPSGDQAPIVLIFNYASDLNANLSGGARRGAAYLGKAAVIADADLDRLIGVHGATAHVSVLNIHGTGLSASRVDNLAAVSGLEAEPALRLNQAWVEFGLGGTARLRLGKFPAAQDFMASDTAAFFVNATFGWPASFATDLPQGGPSWPLAAPGAMMKAPISKSWTLSAAVFAGTPVGRMAEDPQRSDDHGFGAFRLAGKPFIIAEAARRIGDAATIELGGWAHFGEFDLLGAEPGQVASPNWSLYALADWRVAGAAADARQVKLFARVSVSPADRNPISVYADLGMELTAPFAGRPGDVVGLAYAMSRLSPRLTARGGPRAEQVIELSYSAAVGSHFALQPNLQLVVDPVDPASFAASGATALVAGLRFTAHF